MKIVLDSNGVVSGICFPLSVCGQILSTTSIELDFVWSDTLVDEIFEVLARSKLDRYVPLEHSENQKLSKRRLTKSNVRLYNSSMQSPMLASIELQVAKLSLDDQIALADWLANLVKTHVQNCVAGKDIEWEKIRGLVEDGPDPLEYQVQSRSQWDL